MDNLMQVICDTSPDIIFAKDREGRMCYANPAALALIGKPLDQVLGLTDAQFLGDASVSDPIMVTDARIMASGIAEEIEEVVPMPDGSRKVWLSRKVPYRDAGGKIIGLLGISRDITDRKRAEEELRETDRRKDEFLATLAHELRNPLAPVLTAAGLLASGKLGEDKAKWAAGVIGRQVKHMKWLLDDLLDISRITTGKLQLKLDALTLADVFDTALETARPSIDERGHQLELQLPDTPVRLHGDAVRLAQIFSNLLINAAKYTPRSGKITVHAVEDDAQVRVAIRDTGIGIAPGSLEKIFTMFSQDLGAVSMSEGGLGLGLALAKGLVEMHGGSITASSDGAGQGAEFLVRLPLLTRQPSVLHATAPLAQAGGRRVLIVDDNVDAAAMLGLLAQSGGHMVKTAHSGEEALAIAGSFCPEIAVLDVGMPGMSGHELAVALQQQEWAADLCLVALTGWGQDSDRKKTNAAGFHIHLTKPVDSVHFSDVLRQPLTSIRAGAAF